MKPEKIHLIHDLLDSESHSRREATLIAGGRILRKRRVRRVMARVFFAVLILGVATISIQKMSTPPRHVTTSVPVPAPPAQGRSLTDDELLALFPDTAVGLITLQNGKKILVFPNPGDEARFITRL